MRLLSYILILSFFYISSAYSSLFDWDYDEVRDKDLHTDAVLVFDATLIIEKKEYRDVYNFAITDEALLGNWRIAKANPWSSKKSDLKLVEWYHYLAEFNISEMIVGEIADAKALKWTYTNHARLSCPHYPRSLALGRPARFFIYKFQDNRVYDVKFRLLNDREVEQPDSTTTDPAVP